MTIPSDRLSEIERSLNRQDWRPTAEEVAFGSTFFQRMKQVEEQPGPAFPRGENWWERLRTESVYTLAQGVLMVQDEMLPAAPERLAESPMKELVEMYVGAAAPLLPHAERLLAAWFDAAVPAPTADEIAREARRLNVPAGIVAARLRYANASRWEAEALPYEVWDGLRPAWAHLVAVQSTMMAAVTGDTDY